MPEWLPVATAFTLATALVGIGIWIGAVNADRKSFKEVMREVRDDIREARDDIKAILSRLPSPEETGGARERR